MKQHISLLKIGVFLGLFGETYLNAALPALMDTFNVSADLIQWLTSAYMLTMGVCVPISAFLIKRLRTKTLYMGALGVLFVGTLLCASAGSFNLLLVARIVQAIGSSVLLPLMMHTIMVTHEVSERGRAMGNAMLVVLFAPALGQTFGGLVLHVGSWRWIFLSTIPFLLFALYQTVRKMHQTPPKERVTFDYLSALFSIAGIWLFVTGAGELLTMNRTSWVPIIIFGLGIVLLVMMVVRQRTLQEPMLDMRVFLNRGYSVGMALITITHMTMFASFILLPMYLVRVLGYSSFLAGLLVLPGGIVGAVVPLLSGRLYDRSGPKIVAGIGFFFLFVMNSYLTIVTNQTSGLTILLSYMVLMGGVGMILTPIQTHSLNMVTAPSLPHGTAIMNTLMLVGSSMGGSFFVSLMASRSQKLGISGLLEAHATLGGIQHAYRFAAISACIGLLLTTLVLPSSIQDTKASMAK